MKEIDTDKFGNKLMFRLLLRFFITMVFFTAALALLFYLILYIGHDSIVWYNPFNLLYRILNFFDDRWIYVFILVWAVGFFLITLYYWKKVISYIGTMVTGIDRLLEPDDNLITFPDELRDVEGRLNQIKYDLMRNQQLAREAEQRKNDLVVYLAHDLKTPLTSVIGYLSLLRDEDRISEELRGKYLSIAVSKAEKLEDLINEFFEITRFNLKDLALNTSRINLTRMLEQIASEFKPLLSPNKLTCSVSAAPDITIPGDANKLERVFDNLIRNAISYSYENSEISISIERKDRDVVIKFCNQGDTIPGHKLNHIFEQFYRLDAARGTEKGGAGLGLAIAKEIVELHCGTITAASENNRIEFSITLPAS